MMPIKSTHEPAVYQKNYTANPVAHEAMYDRAGRMWKARKILSVLKDSLGNLDRLHCLDLSCSTGIMTKLFAQHFAAVEGIDIDEKAIGHAQLNNAGENIRYHVMDALQTSFKSETFDVIICNQMYEHVPDAQELMVEVHRLLKPEGICYFGATNRLKLVEPHYGKIPLLSLVPRSWADAFLRFVGKSDFYYEKLLTLGELKQLVNRFDVIDYTRKVVINPEKYYATDMITPGSIRQKFALAVLSWAGWLFPGYIWLLRRLPDD